MNGRLLLTFEYDANGIRTRKGDHYFFNSDDKVILEIKSLRDENSGAHDSEMTYYYYGKNGVEGFTVNDEIYFYGKNLQGDITEIYDAEFGQRVGKYVYDAWGNCTIVLDTNGVASANPFRYRGYYFDTETGLYYVKSRYYDPSTARWISPDDDSVLNATPTELTDKNLYAYCDNNPVSRVDDDGEFWSEVGVAVAIVAGAVAIGALVVATGGLAAGAAVGGVMAIATTTTTTAALGVATVAGEVALGGLAFHALAAVLEDTVFSSSKNPDPYARPGQKKQGRERKNKARKNPNWKDKSKPKKPKKHTPGRDHRKD